MAKLQNLSSLSNSYVQSITNSVDTVLFDVDGVLLHTQNIIPGSLEAVTKLRQLGKRIGFVTNNSAYSIQQLQRNLKVFGATEDEILNPNLSLLQYLKQIDFKKDIYVISGSTCVNLLRDAGYKVIHYKDIQTTEIEEQISAIKHLCLKSLEICKNVGMVYLDTDLNAYQGAFQVAEVILNHIDGVELLKGMCDDEAPVGDNLKIICSQYHIDGIERWTKRKARPVGKPSNILSNLINHKYKISDSSRVLMVGDNVEMDIGLGAIAGYKTCLVLSGITKKENVDNWMYAEELKPDFIANKFGDWYSKIKDMV